MYPSSSMFAQTVWAREGIRSPVSSCHHRRPRPLLLPLPLALPLPLPLPLPPPEGTKLISLLPPTHCRCLLLLGPAPSACKRCCSGCDSSPTMDSPRWKAAAAAASLAAYMDGWPGLHNSAAAQHTILAGMLCTHRLGNHCSALYTSAEACAHRAGSLGTPGRCGPQYALPGAQPEMDVHEQAH